MVVRKHYYVSGRVQGVGFRYRAYYTAGMLGLTGYVRNLEDGRVELEIQGQSPSIENFFERLQAGTFISINGMECHDLTVDAQEQGFEIR